jgi:hypothetical protein
VACCSLVEPDESLSCFRSIYSSLPRYSSTMKEFPRKFLSKREKNGRRSKSATPAPAIPTVPDSTGNKNKVRHYLNRNSCLMSDPWNCIQLRAHLSLRLVILTNSYPASTTLRWGFHGLIQKRQRKTRGKSRSREREGYRTSTIRLTA